MRIFLIALICIGLTACAKPQIVKQHFPPEKTLHMTRVKEVTDAATINQYVFYLDKGDTVPLKLKMDTSLLEFKEPHVNLTLKKKLYFRIDLAEEVSQADLEKVLAMTPEQLAKMAPNEMRALADKFRIYLSQDGITWALLMDHKAVKQVFGIKHGSINFGMALSGDEGMWLLFSISLHDQPLT